MAKEEFDIFKLLQLVQRGAYAKTEDDLDPKKRRDNAYADLVVAYKDHYINKATSNQILKKWFFGLTFGILFLLIVGIIVFTIFLLKSNQGEDTALVGIVSAIIGLISSIIILPSIMARYLFPKNEDEYIKDMIVHMRDADEHINTEEDAKEKDQKNKSEKGEKGEKGE